MYLVASPQRQSREGFAPEKEQIHERGKNMTDGVRVGCVDTAFGDATGGLKDQEWDALTGDLLYSSRDWLSFCATDVGGRATVGAVHARDRDGALTAVPVTALEDEPNSFYQWHTQMTDRGLPAPGAAGLLLGQRRGYQTNLLRSSDSREATVAELLAQVRDVHRDLAGSGLLTTPPVDPLGCVALFLGTGDVLSLRSAGVSVMPVLLAADAWMPIPASGWTEWLQSLPSKGRRDSVKQEVKAFSCAGYEVVRKELGRCYEQAAELLACTQKRYGHPYDLGVLTESFRRQAAAMGPAAQVLFCARSGEAPVGFCLFYIQGDTLFVRAVGFDYERLRGAAEYFNLAYYETVRLAAEHGLRWVHPGIESSDAKALRGARIRPLWLLDLAEDSVLLDSSAEIRAHNADRFARLGDTSSAVAKALERDLFAPFC